MTVKERMHNGDLYDPGNEEIMAEQAQCLELLCLLEVAVSLEGDELNRVSVVVVDTNKALHSFSSFVLADSVKQHSFIVHRIYL